MKNDLKDVYIELLDIFSEMVDPEKRARMTKSPKLRDKLASRMAVAGMRMAVEAPDSILHAFIEYRDAAKIYESDVEIMQAFGNVLVALRKELFPETKMKTWDLLSCFIVDAEDVAKRSEE